jgi:peptidyl-prolyl cis-trans isomerase SurA
MKRVSLIVLLTVVAISCLNAQTNDPALLTVAGEKVSKTDFLNVYKKNNIKGEVMDRKSLEEYLDLFINFKLKVKEAEEQKLDTFTSFKTELAGYRKQLAQPYMTDKVVDEDLIKEAFDRAQWDIRASHILIMVDKNAAPEDTLKAYNKVMDIRKLITGAKDFVKMDTTHYNKKTGVTESGHAAFEKDKINDSLIIVKFQGNGGDFAKVAMAYSEDRSARDRIDPGSKANIKGNGGDLGYFSVLDMIYPFENAAYNTKVGSVSMPVRTDYGYHLIKVVNRQPAMGKVVVAHIYVSVPKDAKPEDLAGYKSKIDEAYSKLKAGAKYEDIVNEYSDDKGSAAKGGVLPGFGVNRMVPEFIDAISKLKNIGDYSDPVQTAYGWHIIKLIERKPIKSFEDEKAQLKARIIKDSRSDKSKESVIFRIKNENNFKEFPETLKDFYTVVDTTIFEAKWDVAAADKLNKTMFVLGDQNFTQKDFAQSLASKQSKRPKINIKNFLNEKFTQYIDDMCLNYEDSKLETKYPEFKSLMKEYRDGIMLFELTDKKVWSKAIQDTTGLKEFYEPNKTKYMWDQRLDASIYTCKDESVAKAARKLVKSVSKGSITEADLLKKINTDSIALLKIEHKKYIKGDNAIIDSVKWEKGVSPDMVKYNKIVFVVVHNLVAPEPKSIKEAKGLITADYQNYLEKEWIEQLRKKYPYEVNKDVFESLLK